MIKSKSKTVSGRKATRSTNVTRVPKPGKSTRVIRTRSTTTSNLAPPELPELKKYQPKAVEWLLARPFAGLFLDPGLGKTLIVLISFWLLKKRGMIDFLIVVAPLLPCYQVWPREVEKWKFPFKVVVLHGDGKDKLVHEKADIYVINYDGLSWLHPYIELLRSRGHGWLVCDESTKAKNTQSLRSRVLKTFLECFARRTILTGTPSPNGYLDLFGQLMVLDLGTRLGTFYTHYAAKFFTQINPQTGEVYVPGRMITLVNGNTIKEPRPPYLTYVPSAKGEKKIREAIADICLRFSDAELGLPPWLPVVKTITLPPKARRIYDALEADFITAVEDEGEGAAILSASNSGVLGMKLRQIANGGLYDDDHNVIDLHYEKADAVLDLVEELSGAPLLVAYEFNHDRDRMRKRLGKDTPSISGEMPIKERLRLCDEFNRGMHRALLVQCSMMEGLNLQATCRHVCWAAIIWNLEHYIQLIKRIHRLGQKHKVIVYHLVADNTRDERAFAVLKRKDRSQKKLLQFIGSYHDL